MVLVDMALQMPCFDSDSCLDHFEVFAGDMSVTHGERQVRMHVSFRLDPLSRLLYTPTLEIIASTSPVDCVGSIRVYQAYHILLHF